MTNPPNLRPLAPGDHHHAGCRDLAEGGVLSSKSMTRTRRDPMAAQLRYTAIHEAGHAVASWAMQKELGRHWQQLRNIMVRTLDEVNERLFDRHGRMLEGLGNVETSDRFCMVTGPRLLERDTLPDGGLESEADHGARVEHCRKLMEADVIDTLAGPLAEARYRHRSHIALFLFEGGRDDWKAANACLESFHGPNSGARLDALLKRSARVINDKRHWRAIEALADSLVERRFLLADEAVRIIEEAVRS